MTGIAPNTEEILLFVVDNYLALRDKDPSHGLLKLINLHCDEMGFNTTPGFITRCVRNTDKDMKGRGYARYGLALEDAIKGRPYKLLDTNPPCEY